ncbi:MAG: hypothetical protein WA104_04895 [Thermodesulfovibrionales bacterium]
MKKIVLIGLMVLALVSYAAAQSQLDAIKKTVPLPDDIMLLRQTMQISVKLFQLTCLPKNG